MVVQNNSASPEDLPSFRFTPQLVFNVVKGMSLEEWLSVVDEQKEKFAWSDYTTIHKVLGQLKLMPEVCTWFSSIGDIMTWEEWKTKLIHAFPSSDDYNINLKRMVIRRKKPGETYAGYYAAKMELVNVMKETGERAVSLLLGGLPASDVLVNCIGRMGNYKTPEQVLAYFKSCDDKQAHVTQNKSPARPDAAAHEKKKDDKTVPKLNDSPTKRKRPKCFICKQRGHMAHDCRSEHSPPGRKPPATTAEQSRKIIRPQMRAPQRNTPIAATQSLVRRKKRAKPQKCTACLKFGHRAALCPLGKRPEARPNQPRNHNVAPQKCFHCGKFDHPSFNCPQPSNAQKRSEQKCSHCGKSGHSAPDCYHAKNKTPGKEYRAQQRRSSQDKACSCCGELGHTQANCYRQKSQKSSQSQKYAQPEPTCSYCGLKGHTNLSCMRAERDKVTQGQREERNGSNCYYCGSYGHEPGACRQARRSGSGGDYYRDSVYSSSAQAASYRQLLCFKCYKIGHETADCTRYAGDKRSMRN